jgi:hypothetical protein
MSALSVRMSGLPSGLCCAMSSTTFGFTMRAAMSAVPYAFMTPSTGMPARISAPPKCMRMTSGGLALNQPRYVASGMPVMMMPLIACSWVSFHPMTVQLGPPICWPTKSKFVMPSMCRSCQR